MNRLVSIGITVVFVMALAAGLRAEGPPEGAGPGPGGGPPMQPGVGGPRSGGSRSPQELEQQVMDFVRQFDPAQAEELQKLKEAQPEAWQRTIMEMAQRMRMLEQMKRMDSQGYEIALDEMKLEGRVRGLARKYREAPAESRATIQKEMRAALEAQFEARESSMRHRIEHMAKELAEMKKRLEERAKNRSAVVDRRLAELTREPGSEW